MKFHTPAIVYIFKSDIEVQGKNYNKHKERKTKSKHICALLQMMTGNSIFPSGGICDKIDQLDFLCVQSKP